MSYDFKSIEQKWQITWQENKIFETLLNSKEKPKFYCLVMFPYPSGHLHMGHVRNYIIGDVIAQYKRMKGFNVFHPIGWDAFGLPAENAAIKNNIHPKKWTKENIDYMRKQLKQLGISYDWSREISTCEPEYYKWNQWLFIKMFEKGLAYRKSAPVNWCPECKTVLANEQVENGACWRCGSNVLEKDLEQWFLKITQYAEELLDGHKLLEEGWPEEVLIMQKNWIGKSVGAEVDFTVGSEKIRIFTTRPDTLFGATFLVLSPEHIFLKKLGLHNKPEIKEYIENSKKKTRNERIANREKTGVFTGLYATNPVNNEKIPVWVADYVLMEYGTGAIMCVPAHDQRDWEFAKRYNLKIKEVIKSPDSNIEKQAYEGEGIMINSGEFNGLESEKGREEITKWLEKKGTGIKKVNYRLKDWLISRQRYWGTPIPIVYCKNCGTVPVSEDELPVVLPENVKITGTGESPLKYVPEFVNTKCPKCSSPAKRETDTMDTFVDSSWYFLRYCDPKNEDLPFDKKIIDYWVPVDQYIGGIEHACMHLMYARFFHKVLRDLGFLSSDEPFTRLLTQGMVTLGGVAMSKSRGNIVEPDEVIEKYGVDTLRLFILFAAPPEKQLEWSDQAIEGCWRFLNRIWRLKEMIYENNQKSISLSQQEKDKILRKLHQTIKKVTEDIEKRYQFNTAIAHIMEL
ncbi:MAG: leucine--tRNA ligase, partial [Endomicrobiia bacterium]